MTQYLNEDDARPIRYAARQPILASDETVIGYEIKFRTDLEEDFRSASTADSSRTAIDMSSLLGLNVLCDNRLAFVDCTRDILVERFLAFLPPERVVAEIGPEIVADEPIEEALSWLKHAGYKIALDSFTVNDRREGLLDFADFLKVDIKETPWEDILRIARSHGNSNIGLIAKKVETPEDFEYARRAGFQFFQGYFFRRPQTIRARGLSSNRTTYLRLLQTISKPELNWDEVEDLLKKDAALYYRLLRYINSAVFGIRGEVCSVSQALTLMGENELRRWCRLAGAFEMSKRRPSDLMLSAMVRARFGESISGDVPHDKADLFLVGLLSMMDAILEIPMSAVLEGFELDEGSRVLLLENQGPLLPIYELIWAVERGDWASVLRACARLGLREDQVAERYSKAMEWAQSITSEV